VLFKEVSQMKRVEESGSRLREYEALNQILKDKLKHSQAEKQGIETTLTQQIAMYKNMATELEEQLEQRVKDMRIVFDC
jgi:hypothetical protein